MLQKGVTGIEKWHNIESFMAKTVIEKEIESTNFILFAFRKGESLFVSHFTSVNERTCNGKVVLNGNIHSDSMTEQQNILLLC